MRELTLTDAIDYWVRNNECESIEEARQRCAEVLSLNLVEDSLARELVTSITEHYYTYYY